MPSVSVVTVEDDTVEEALNKAIDLIGGDESMRDRKMVAVKPNLCRPKSSSSGTTTDPRIVDALIKKVNSHSKCQINIVETNNSQANADETFRRLGYNELCRKYDNVRCVNLSKDRRIRVSLDGNILRSILVPESMIFCDCLISVAKLKTHVDYRYTGVLKNQYGFLLSLPRRVQYHGFMSKVIADLNSFYRPDLSIVDGLIGMEGFGPIDGTPKHVGKLIASMDPVAADAVGAQLIGIPPSSIEYLRYAEKKGIGTTRDLHVIGCDLAQAAVRFTSIPGRYSWLGGLALALGRYSTYVSNLAEVVRLSRSALSTVGFSELQRRISYAGLSRLAIDTLLRLAE
jgi:uncharacterized protein (DUF362 family)